MNTVTRMNRQSKGAFLGTFGGAIRTHRSCWSRREVEKCERSETITSVRNVPERNEKGRQYRQYFLNLEDLHAGLEIKSKYADWFKNMSTYGFTENEDYMTVSKNLENGGRIIEHFISVDMAKQICMIQRNERGRRADADRVKHRLSVATFQNHE